MILRRLRGFRLRLFVADEYKPLRMVSPWLWAAAFGAFGAQLAFHHWALPPPTARAEDYVTPPSENTFRIAAFGEPVTLAKLLVLRLQAFDNQPGVSIPFRELSYESLGMWLDRVVALDDRAEYPHFLMSKIYSAVNNDSRRRFSAEWTWRQFLAKPEERWEWMGHAANMAKYVLKDDELALAMARDVRKNTRPGKIPGWARQMEIFFLENQDEFEAAAALLERQLAAGEAREPQEYAFLHDRLKGMLKELYKRGDITNAQLRDRIARLESLDNKYLEQFEER